MLIKRGDAQIVTVLDDENFDEEEVKKALIKTKKQIKKSEPEKEEITKE